MKETFTKQEVVELIVKSINAVSKAAGATVYGVMDTPNESVKLFRKGFFRDTHYKTETFDEVILDAMAQ